jgi:hypothetical protein
MALKQKPKKKEAPQTTRASNAPLREPSRESKLSLSPFTTDKKQALKDSKRTPRLTSRKEP